MIFRMSQTILHRMDEKNGKIKRKSKNGEPVSVVNNLTSKIDITTMVDKLLSKKQFDGVSSIFIVVPTSDDNDTENSSYGQSSTSSIHSTENNTSSKNSNAVEPGKNFIPHSH